MPLCVAGILGFALSVIIPAISRCGRGPRCASHPYASVLNSIPAQGASPEELERWRQRWARERLAIDTGFRVRFAGGNLGRAVAKCDGWTKLNLRDAVHSAEPPVAPFRIFS